MPSAIAKAEEIGKDPNFFILQQFENPANPAIHVSRRPAPRSGTTRTATSTSLSPALGTGGTITGVSRYFKEVRGKKIQSIAVEAAPASPVLSGGQRGKHKIQGTGGRLHPGDPRHETRRRSDPGHRRGVARNGSRGWPVKKDPVGDQLRASNGRRPQGRGPS